MKEHSHPLFRYLAGYYGLLQSCHIVMLARAGWFLIRSQPIPFPASPPPGGWTPDTLPFLVGMGMVDVFAILLGLYFVYRLIIKHRLHPVVGLISLTAAISSGVIYLVGTIPSGAWQANLGEYLAVLILFGPVIPLYLLLLRGKDFRVDPAHVP